MLFQCSSLKMKKAGRKVGHFVHSGQRRAYFIENELWNLWTRAPRGTDRSPEYNEHFCYKLDSRVKNLTTEWNQKQQHFITHASRSLLWIRFLAVACSLQVWRRSFFKKGTPPPPPWPFLPRPGSAPGQIWPKHLYACAGPWALHPYQVS